MTRRKKDQDVLLFKIRLGREEVEIPLSVLYDISLKYTWNPPFPKAGLKQSNTRIK